MPIVTRESNSYKSWKYLYKNSVTLFTTTYPEGQQIPNIIYFFISAEVYLASRYPIIPHIALIIKNETTCANELFSSSSFKDIDLFDFGHLSMVWFYI